MGKTQIFFAFRSRRSLSCEVQQLDLSQSNDGNLAVNSRNQQARRHSFSPVQSGDEQIMPTTAAMSETGPTSREKVNRELLVRLRRNNLVELASFLKIFSKSSNKFSGYKVLKTA